jgi:hypothetical protein
MLLHARVCHHPEHGINVYGARFRQEFSLEDAIEFRAFVPLEALAGVRPMVLLSGVPLPLTGWHRKLRANAEGQSEFQIPDSKVAQNINLTNAVYGGRAPVAYGALSSLSANTP